MTIVLSDAFPGYSETLFPGTRTRRSRLGYYSEALHVAALPPETGSTSPPILVVGYNSFMVIAQISDDGQTAFPIFVVRLLDPVTNAVLMNLKLATPALNGFGIFTFGVADAATNPDVWNTIDLSVDNQDVDVQISLIRARLWGTAR